MTAADGSRWSILRCPACRTQVVRDSGGARCAGCGTVYPDVGGVLDLRLQQEKVHDISFTVGQPPLRADELEFVPLRARADPAHDFEGVEVPNHLTPAILSHVPAPPAGGGVALDLGCGWGVHRQVVEHAGYAWIGLDYAEQGAPLLGDAHALPFADASFDFILTIAVLEHLRYPFVGMHEAHRVLKPGSMMIGTVAFLEPFHGDSLYHHSHLGTLNTLRHAGFDVDVVAPHADWTVVRAQAEMGLFPGASTRFRRLVVGAVECTTRRRWRGAGLDDNVRLRNTAGAFTFIARRPWSPSRTLGP